MSSRPASNSVPVFSTEQGRMCPKCGRPAASCVCSQAKTPPKADATVRVARQTKGRKGKGVCLITGLPLAGENLEKLARQLKRRLGVGGAVKDGVVEIQGDRREAVVQELAKLGYKAKLAGG